MAHNKVLRWFNGKNGEEQEDFYTKSTDGRRYEIQWQKPHETVPRELWKNNTVGKTFQSARYNRDFYNDSNRKHHSLPVQSKNRQVENLTPRTPREIVVDSRRFEMQKEEEKKKQLESRGFDNNSITARSLDNSSNTSNTSNTSSSIDETLDKEGKRSRKESQQSVRTRRESQQSVRRDSSASQEIQQEQFTKRGSRTSLQESQQSMKRDSRASHRESNVERYQNELSSTPENEEIEIPPSSSTSISDKPPLPKKSPSRFRERRISGICPLCRGKLAEGGYCVQWCQRCESKKFEKKFGTWTSGNDIIDTLILESQLSAKSRFDYLEWIPFDRFKDIQLIGSGGIGSVYQAIWLDGPREKWDKKARQYVRCGEWRIALRGLDNSDNVSSSFFEELKAHLHCENNSGNYVTRCYGITQDTKTGDYLIVVQYARNGNLRKYMKKNSAGVNWKRRLDILYGVATGLHRIHRENIVHRNLHSGNVLINSYMTLISDLGICRRADSNETDGIFGILPYVAPEVLRAKPFTTAADVYSFGTIMWELAFGRKPFGDRAHDLELAKEIVNGLRPEIIEEMPKCYLKLMKSCWDSDPFMRPSAKELYGTLGEWLCKVHNVPTSNIAMQFAEAENLRLESIKQGAKSSSTPDQIESPIQSPTNTSFNNIGENEVEFKSRFLNFKSLQEPPIISFTRTYRSREHLALREYLIAETESYNAKYEMMQADNTEIAAEVYEILQYL